MRLRVERRWATLADDVSAMAGQTLLHTDVNPENLLITPDGRAVLVDWAFASRGAPWMELSLLIPWLLKAGHTPAEADAWLAQFPSWAAADPDHIDLFSELFAQGWGLRVRAPDRPAWIALHADVTRRWAEHRRGAR